MEFDCSKVTNSLIWLFNRSLVSLLLSLSPQLTMGHYGLCPSWGCLLPALICSGLFSPSLYSHLPLYFQSEEGFWPEMSPTLSPDMLPDPLSYCNMSIPIDTSSHYSTFTSTPYPLGAIVQRPVNLQTFSSLGEALKGQLLARDGVVPMKDTLVQTVELFNWLGGGE